MSAEPLVRTVLDRLEDGAEPGPGPAGAPAPGVSELLASAPASHRRAVASALGLAAAASAAQIAAAVRDPERLAAVVKGLSADARRRAARAAYLGDATVYQSWNGRADPATSELERHGLAFAFRRSYNLEYHVPYELHTVLADLLAAPYAGRLKTSEPRRVLETPLQLGHDIAALWAQLARSPVRVKANGPVYQRDLPSLLAALPAAELHDSDGPIARFRLEFVLGILRDEGLIAVRVNNLPGSAAGRELIATGNPASLLAIAPNDLRTRLLRHLHLVAFCQPALALAKRIVASQTVSIESFGRALRTLCDDLQLGLDLSASDFALGMGVLHVVWLAGAVTLGVDRDGIPSTVSAAPAPSATDGRIVCQANFELVALAPPTPAQRLVLALACDPVPDQAHVFRLTRDSVRAGQRCAVLDGGVAAALERLTGELPQNVSRSLADWSSSVRRPLRLRTAMLLDTGDAETAEALLAGELGRYVVERLGPSQLAIRAGKLVAAQAALRSAGHELDPGLERVSGRWSERDPVPSDAERVWARGDPVEAPDGKLVSTIANARRPQAAALGRAPEPIATVDGDPLDVVLDAIERGSDVLILYAGASGTTQRQITPYEIEGAAVRAFCHLRRDERSFWLASIRDAVPVPG
jgi:hypothetical protein